MDWIACRSHHIVSHHITSHHITFHLFSLQEIRRPQIQISAHRRAERLHILLNRSAALRKQQTELKTQQAYKQDSVNLTSTYIGWLNFIEISLTLSLNMTILSSNPRKLSSQSYASLPLIQPIVSWAMVLSLSTSGSSTARGNSLA